MGAEERVTQPPTDPAPARSADPEKAVSLAVEAPDPADALAVSVTPGSRPGAAEAIRRLADDLLPALVARLDASGLGELEVRTDAWRIRLRKPYERRGPGSAAASPGSGLHRAAGTVPGSAARGARPATAAERHAHAESTHPGTTPAADGVQPGAGDDPLATPGGSSDAAPGGPASTVSAAASAGSAGGSHAAGPAAGPHGAGSAAGAHAAGSPPGSHGGGSAAGAHAAGSTPGSHPAAPVASATPAVATSPAVGYFVPREGWTSGRRAQSGDVIGYVDCLGIRQEVVAPVDGFIGRLLAQSGEAVEYGQPLVQLDLPGRAPDDGPADTGAPARADAGQASTAPSGAGPAAAASAPASEGA